MSYDNTEPKILKTLNSSGQVLDDAGNVIGNSSDYWVRTYNQAEPKSDKILYSDGTIKDGAGNLIQNSTPFNVKKYNQAEPIPAKYLHADGTIDENAGGAGTNLEDNKEVEITENGEIEITPSSGYDGMKKVTATINVSGGDVPIEPSPYAPDWFEENEPLSSVPPEGVKCFFSDSYYDYNSSSTIEGNGVDTLETLLYAQASLSITSSVYFVVSCGNIVVFAYASYY